MREDLTEIGLVIDESGSMHYKTSDTIGGFNTFLATQKAAPGEANLTMVKFSTDYNLVHDGADIQSVEDLTLATYIPGGGTALFDAMSRAITQIVARLSGIPDEKRAKNVIIVVMTDGEENSSREVTLERLAQQVTVQQDKHGWNFIFLGADMDAFSVGAAIGLHVGAVAKPSTVHDTYKMADSAVSFLRSTGSVGPWKDSGEHAHGPTG